MARAENDAAVIQAARAFNSTRIGTAAAKIGLNRRATESASFLFCSENFANRAQIAARLKGLVRIAAEAADFVASAAACSL